MGRTFRKKDREKHRQQRKREKRRTKDDKTNEDWGKPQRRAPRSP
jgi:hypothetical protein